MLAAERTATQNTISSYRADLEKFFFFLDRKHINIVSAKYSDLVHYIDYLTCHSFSASSIARKISCMRQFFSFLLSEDLRNDNPAELLSTPKKAICLPKALAENDLDVLFQALSKDDSSEGIRNATMLEVLYSTGMRISELVTLKIQCLEHNEKTDKITNTMVIRGKGGKERLVVLNDGAILKLSEYLVIRRDFLKKHKQQSNWLFPSAKKNGLLSHISRQRFGQILKELALQNNIDPNIISPHKIRHSFATHMLKGGADIKVIQELMGHASINSTQIYTKICSEDAKAALQKHPLASGFSSLELQKNKK
jgi:integrase/recombinase XerD